MLSLLLLLALLSPVVVAPAADGALFRDLSGACQGSPDRPLLWDAALAWDRHDLGWAECEPKLGQWSQAALDTFGARVLAAKAKGVTVLPVLGYNAPWSWDHTERTFAHGTTQWHVVPRDDGRFDVITAQRQADGWHETKREVQRGGGMWPLAAAHQADWEAYVRRVVAFLHAPPYGLEYFQIWNEAHPLSGFWFGDLDSYMQRVHLPAARVIRAAGAKVVYGGWPSCGSVAEYVALLDKHQAWDTLDVLDVHYFGLGVWPQLQAAARPHGGKAIWQTEVGFTSSPEFVPNTWPRFLFWALSHGGDRAPDLYRQFLFAYWSPDDPKAYGYGCCLLSGDHLSAHGRALATLGELCGTQPVHAYADVVTEPALALTLDGGKDSAEAFATLQRVVVALHLRRAQMPATVRVRLPQVPLAQATQAARVSATGDRLTLTPQADGAGTQLMVPTAGLGGGGMVTCYAVVELGR